MASKLIVGIDGGNTGSRAVAHATKMARRIGDCELVLVYVIEWSPFSFQTPEENEQRHKRREEEIVAAETRIVIPAVEALTREGVQARGMVKHGNVAETLDRIAKTEEADQIIVGRSSEIGLVDRLFGSSMVSLVLHASVPVTVVV